MKKRKRALRIAGIALALVAFADAVYLRALWPDWEPIEKGPVPRSRFLRDWEKANHKKAKWTPVAIDEIPEKAVRAVLIAEDANFWGHEGFDSAALREALAENVSRGKVAFGGSTISQQTAKNLFLTPSRSPLRKWHEAVLTWALERNVSKRRILEIYLNVVELGPGVYGFEAAAQEYFGAKAADLTQAQAIELAASLPSPRKDNPSTRTERFDRRVKKITRWLALLQEIEPPPTPTPSPISSPEDLSMGTRQ